MAHWDMSPAMLPYPLPGTIADVSGESVVSRLHFHPPSGSIAVGTALRGHEGEAAHQRVPLLHLVDGATGVGAPERSPIHSGVWASI